MLAGRRVTVLGAGRSGRAAATLAASRGAHVVLTDRNPEATPLGGVENVFGHHRDEDLVEADVLVVSPGVPAAAPPVAMALAAGVDVVGELGFASRLLPPVPTIAITGTNGKSTVTSFTAQLLEQTGRTVFAGGNLGTPLSAAVDGSWDALVVEVSSYQLELPGSFTCQVAAVLNLATDHLARHGTMEVYAEHKCRLFDTLPPGGWACVPHDPRLVAAAEGRAGVRRWLDALPGVVVEGGTARYDDGKLDVSSVWGAVNQWNAGVAGLLAHGLGARFEELDASALVGLPHRLELVAERDGVRFVNDSKATNLASTEAALAGQARPAVVLLGGKAKEGSDFGSLAAALRDARAVICFGGSGEAIARQLAALTPLRTDTMAEAVHAARRLARSGDDVLLSPGCASFDEFDDFEHRGREFARLAREEVR